MAKGFNPNQPRDKSGMWTTAGGAARVGAGLAKSPTPQDAINQKHAKTLAKKLKEDGVKTKHFSTWSRINSGEEDHPILAVFGGGLVRVKKNPSGKGVQFDISGPTGKVFTFTQKKNGSYDFSAMVTRIKKGIQEELDLGSAEAQKFMESSG